MSSSSSTPVKDKVMVLSTDLPITSEAFIKVTQDFSYIENNAILHVVPDSFTEGMIGDIPNAITMMSEVMISPDANNYVKEFIIESIATNLVDLTAKMPVLKSEVVENSDIKLLKWLQFWGIPETVILPNELISDSTEFLMAFGYTEEVGARISAKEWNYKAYFNEDKPYYDQFKKIFESYFRNVVSLFTVFMGRLESEAWFTKYDDNLVKLNPKVDLDQYGAKLRDGRKVGKTLPSSANPEQVPKKEETPEPKTEPKQQAPSAPPAQQQPPVSTPAPQVTTKEDKNSEVEEKKFKLPSNFKGLKGVQANCSLIETKTYTKAEKLEKDNDFSESFRADLALPGKSRQSVNSCRSIWYGLSVEVQKQLIESLMTCGLKTGDAGKIDSYGVKQGVGATAADKSMIKNFQHYTNLTAVFGPAFTDGKLNITNLCLALTAQVALVNHAWVVDISNISKQNDVIYSLKSNLCLYGLSVDFVNDFLINQLLLVRTIIEVLEAHKVKFSGTGFSDEIKVILREKCGTRLLEMPTSTAISFYFKSFKLDDGVATAILYSIVSLGKRLKDLNAASAYQFGKTKYMPITVGFEPNKMYKSYSNIISRAFILIRRHVFTERRPAEETGYKLSTRAKLTSFKTEDEALKFIAEQAGFNKEAIANKYIKEEKKEDKK